MSVPENMNPGAVVGTVKALDSDTTDQLYYYLRGKKELENRVQESELCVL